MDPSGYVHLACAFCGVDERMNTRQVSAADFKAKCLCIIKQMGSDGHPVTITKRGRPVAVLSPLPPQRRRCRRLSA